MNHEFGSPTIDFKETVDGDTVEVEKALDFSIITYRDGTVSIQGDDGHVTNRYPDGSIDEVGLPEGYAELEQPYDEFGG